MLIRITITGTANSIDEEQQLSNELTKLYILFTRSFGFCRTKNQGLIPNDRLMEFIREVHQ